MLKSIIIVEGFCRLFHGLAEPAITDFDEAIRLKPDCAEAYYYRGSAKFQLGQYKSAITDFDEAIPSKTRLW